MIYTTDDRVPFQPALDKMLYATLSIYIHNERLEDLFANWTPETRRTLQTEQRKCGDLSWAIDPLFNDIAIRDRYSAVDEFLFDLDGARKVEPIRITIPSSIEWETEGQRMRAQLGGPVAHDIDVRSFWYVHNDGSLSFHLSFLLHYEHTLEDFYFLSMLQKLMFPKELSQKRDAVADDICSGHTGVWALDLPAVTRIQKDAENGETVAEAMPYWTFVRTVASQQLSRFVKAAQLKQRTTPIHDDYGLWRALVACDATSFIEIPGLKAPRARSVFLFQDEELFDLLRPENRDSLHCNPNYAPIVPPECEEDGVITISSETLAIEPRSNVHGYDPRYYFLAGFFQNIIDFFNQDVSELRDGTKPIYPHTPQQAEDALFVRFANGRSLFQIVARSRSLDAGNDYIGTCPYLFLVHLMALHNEFVVRLYEEEIDKLQRQLADENLTRHGSLGGLLAALYHETERREPVSSRDLQRATAMFYKFRLRAFTFFKRHLYENTLRYETERDLFESLQRIRGIQTRLDRCEAVVDGLDRTMKDLEDDKRHRDQREARQSEGRLSKLVGIVGLFSVVQASFQALDAYRLLFESRGDGGPAPCRFGALSDLMVKCNGISDADTTALVLIGGTLAGILSVLIFAGYALTTRDRT